MKKFQFNKDNLARAQWHIQKYPEGRQESAVLPLLDLAQRQNGGYLDKDCIDYVSDMLHMPAIRVYEVASFYSMLYLKPVGKFHIQVCGTTPCWLRGSGDLMDACKKHLDIDHGQVTADGKFGLSEVECLGACANAPMVQINDDYYEDLTPERMIWILKELKAGRTPGIGSQVGRISSEPFEGETPEKASKLKKTTVKKKTEADRAP